MELIVYLIALVLGGLLVGALGRLALPGRDPMTILQTIAVGVAGSLAAGLVMTLVFGDPTGGGLLLSVLFATVIVYFVRRSRGGSLSSPAGRDRLARR